MAATATHTRPVDTDALIHATALRERATSLRAQADHLPELLAASYRRRASEVELEAWVTEVQSGVPYDEVHSAA
jgi:hypothetical protein